MLADVPPSSASCMNRRVVDWNDLNAFWYATFYRTLRTSKSDIPLRAEITITPCFREIPLAMGDSNGVLPLRCTHPDATQALYPFSFPHVARGSRQKPRGRHPPFR